MSLLFTSGIIAARRRGWIDPLVGISFSLRLQTHRGDGIPLGLYQDTACTIPATADGHSVAAWRDEISGSNLVATQSVSTKRPILRLLSGIPTVKFDGVDDFLSVTLPRPFPFSLATGAKSASTASGGMSGYGSTALAIGNGFSGFAPDGAFWLWGPNSGTTYGETGTIDTSWHVHKALIESGSNSAWTMVRDGIEVGSVGLTGSSLTDTATTLYLGADGNDAVWNGHMTSYLQAGGIWNSATVAHINQYLASILP
jgi:hypothetical protein